MTRTYRTLLSSRGGVLRQEPCWYTVRNMHGALLESRPIAPGSDLKRAFVVAMLEYIDAGWKLGEFGSRVGVFFLHPRRRTPADQRHSDGSRRSYADRRLASDVESGA
jgi:hypothetical protein